ncbi:MAG TPA: hypothetical protein VN112_21835 [Ensifer sp.]|nr:hypothetical protein [Ensifer sp.]
MQQTLLLLASGFLNFDLAATVARKLQRHEAHPGRHCSEGELGWIFKRPRNQ